jgi:hypothetical protein
MITPLDYFSLRYIKDQVFSMNVGSDVIELHSGILIAVASMKLKMPENKFHEIKYHLDILHAINGNHIETH